MSDDEKHHTSSGAPDELNEINLHDTSYSGGMGETKPNLKFYQILGGITIVLLLLFLILSIVAAADGIHRPSVSYGAIRVFLPLDAMFIGMTAGLYALVVVIALTYTILSAPVGVNNQGGAEMVEISAHIKEGSHAFLKKEYKILGPIILIVAVILVFADFTGGGWKTAINFIVGAATSALCGWIGMDLATSANVRTTHQARSSMNAALRLAFNAGTVMGMSVVGFGLLMLSLMTLIFQNTKYLAGFGFGASTVALFARVGGGIFTKAADVGSDLVGKVENDIPEDDPRNPGVIADNVGDNVGDVAGMGADLFESYVGSIIAAMTLGKNLNQNADNAVAAPFYLAAAGIMCSVIGASLVKTSDTTATGDVMKKLLWAVRKGTFIAAFLDFIAAVLIIILLRLDWWVCINYVLGLVAGILIGISTEYYTSFAYKPTQLVAQAGVTGAATVVIRGFSLGMMSNVFPVIIIFLTTLSCVTLGDKGLGSGGGEYCIAIAAVGMLSTLGVTLATDAYGPVADNAGGIAEMAHLPESVRQTTDALDALGNTTAATGKGFAIGSAVLTALALLRAFAGAAYRSNTPEEIKSLNILQAQVIAGVMIGVLLPYVFSALTMTAVGDAAQAIIEEVRRQFNEIPGLRAGEKGVKAEYAKCVDIATSAALKKMIAPGLLAILVPLIVGVLWGPDMLVGLLGGAIMSGFMLSVTMANAGGAWDNAKKYVESGGVTIQGEVKKKGSDLHKATVVGDTIGDPFKDTSGPSLNILIKLMSIVALVFVPLFQLIHKN